MKPCSQKQLALLALNALNPDEARDLQLHVDGCQSCRACLEEFRTLSRTIARIEPLADLPRAPDFHQSILRRLELERPQPLPARISNLLRNFTLPWRTALPLLGASSAAIALLLVLHHQRKPLAPGDSGPQATVALSTAKPDFAPTLSTYQFLANHSPEKLDEALALQASRNPAPAPLYTAATLSRSELSE